MLPCHSCYICGGEGVGGLKLSHGGKGKKPQRRETFMGRHKKTTQGVDH